MTKTKKVVRTIVVAGVLCALASIATFSAFTSQADNPGNNVTAGTVTLTSNSPATAMYSMTAAKPGESSTAKCIKVSYTGSLTSNVKFYSPSTIGSLGQHVNLKVEKGTQGTTTGNGDCAGFTANGGDLFNGNLNTLPSTYAGGIAAAGPSTGTWSNGDAVAYRVTATLSSSAPDSAQGQSTNSHVLRWEAQNN
jgi:hypothetical protein